MNLIPQFYKQQTDGVIQCQLCPNFCRLQQQESGICGVRRNVDGAMELPYAGAVSAMAMDPVEKKPLYHFYPNTQVFSVGFFGCSFKCPFCQNNEISQHHYDQRIISPDELIGLAVSRNASAIAYTYNEPSIHYEYVYRCAELAAEKGMKNILVTNGYINPEPAKRLYEIMDAANIDLKSFSQSFYKKELKGKIEPVKKAIKIAEELMHLEVTTLVIPGKNDSEKEIADIAKFIASIRKDIPLHLSAYYPNYKYKIPATKHEQIYKLKEIAEQYLDYVYPGNVGINESDTYCKVCGSLLISRRGYSTSIVNKDKKYCDKCRQKLPYFM